MRPESYKTMSPAPWSFTPQLSSGISSWQTNEESRSSRSANVDLPWCVTITTSSHELEFGDIL